MAVWDISELFLFLFIVIFFFFSVSTAEARQSAYNDEFCISNFCIFQRGQF